MVRRSAAAGSAAGPAPPGQAPASSGERTGPAAPAPGAQSAAGQSSGKGPAGEAAPEEIDESLFFSETGQLP